MYKSQYLTVNCSSADARAVQCGSNNLSLRRRSAYALQESSRGWSDSVTPGNVNWIHTWYRSERQRSVLHHGWRYRTLRQAPLQIPGSRQPFSVGSVEALPRPHPRLLSAIATRFCDTPLFEQHCTAHASCFSILTRLSCCRVGIIELTISHSCGVRCISCRHGRQ